LGHSKERKKKKTRDKEEERVVFKGKEKKCGKRNQELIAPNRQQVKGDPKFSSKLGAGTAKVTS